ncbi:hypothetical protein SNE40_014540 [Patella caerulea]|uniref:Homeobox domain-containing protein n=1 Tax=Patella caerulea TaxID=87958 RepID=A0AAN8JFV3_PATCE
MKYQEYTPFNTGMLSVGTSFCGSRKDGGVRKRHRTHFTSKQVEKLEEIYRQTPTPYRELIVQLSSVLNLTDKNISIWFKNRRAKTRRQEKSGTEKVEKTVQGSADVVTASGDAAMETIIETPSVSHRDNVYEPHYSSGRLDDTVAETDQSSKGQQNIPAYSPYRPYSLPTYQLPTADSFQFYNTNTYQEFPTFDKYPNQVYSTDLYHSYQQNGVDANYNTPYYNINYNINKDTPTEHIKPLQSTVVEESDHLTPSITTLLPASSIDNNLSFPTAPVSPVSENSNSTSDIFSSSYSSLSSLL